MGVMKRIRPSNLVILAAAPFILYLFATSKNYQRSLWAIIGVEDNAGALLHDFLLILTVFALGCVLPVLALLGRLDEARSRSLGFGAAFLGLLGGLYLSTSADIAAFLNSVIANSVDPYTSALIVKATLPRRLTPEALDMVVA